MFIVSPREIPRIQLLIRHYTVHEELYIVMATTNFAEEPIADKGETCKHHPEKEMILYCESCARPACTKCISTVHRGHIMCDFLDVIPEKRKEIAWFITKTEANMLDSIGQDVEFTNNEIKRTRDHFSKMVKDVKSQDEELKTETEKLTDKFVSDCENFEEENIKVLTIYRQKLEDRLAKLKKLTQDCKTSLQRGTNVHIFNLSEEVQALSPFPVRPTVASVSFVPNKTPHDLMKRAFGKSMMSVGQMRDRRGSLPRCIISSDFNHSASKANSSEETDSPRLSDQYLLLPQTKTMSEFTTQVSVNGIRPTANDMAWIYSEKNEEIQLLNINGCTQRRIQFAEGVGVLCVSPTTQNIWICFHGKTSIMECSQSSLKPNRMFGFDEKLITRPVIRFSTDHVPLCLCVTRDEHILVGMAQKLAKFTTEGKAVRTRDGDTGTGRSMVARMTQAMRCYPCSIAECRVTQNIAVAEAGGKFGISTVLVLDKYLVELFRYHGVTFLTRTIRTADVMGMQFYPFDVGYDRAGNLLICDRNQSYLCIHLISGKDGQFMKMLHTTKDKSLTIGVGREDLLWVVSDAAPSSRRIKRLQYCTT